jgi:2-amino-4-hydroxy-6-hydroxymethyldihydropteridine diphosphokinase
MKYENVFVGLGSNLGDRQNFLIAALKRIANLSEIDIVAFSSIYESEPIGYLNQGHFLNIVAQLSTNIEPQTLLREAQRIENDLGRVRAVRWGPRTIDIDILYWGRQMVSTPDLRIPHPQAERRRFVLAPLNEIAPQFEAPPHFNKVSQLLAEVSDSTRVEIFLPKENLFN